MSAESFCELVGLKKNRDGKWGYLLLDITLCFSPYDDACTIFTGLCEITVDLNDPESIKKTKLFLIINNIFKFIMISCVLAAFWLFIIFAIWIILSVK